MCDGCVASALPVDQEPRSPAGKAPAELERGAPRPSRGDTGQTHTADGGPAGTGNHSVADPARGAVRGFGGPRLSLSAEKRQLLPGQESRCRDGVSVRKGARLRLHRGSLRVSEAVWRAWGLTAEVTGRAEATAEWASFLHPSREKLRPCFRLLEGKTLEVSACLKQAEKPEASHPVLTTKTPSLISFYVRSVFSTKRNGPDLKQGQGGLVANCPFLLFPLGQEVKLPSARLLTNPVVQDLGDGNPAEGHGRRDRARPEPRGVPGYASPGCDGSSRWSLGRFDGSWWSNTL